MAYRDPKNVAYDATMRALMAVPFNEAAHYALLTTGYVRERYDAAWEDVGDAENGPELDGHPAFDLYIDADSHVIIDETGRAYYELRDPELEAYLEAMGVAEFQ